MPGVMGMGKNINKKERKKNEKLQKKVMMTTKLNVVINRKKRKFTEDTKL